MIVVRVEGVHDVAANRSSAGSEEMRPAVASCAEGQRIRGQGDGEIRRSAELDLSAERRVVVHGKPGVCRSLEDAVERVIAEAEVHVVRPESHVAVLDERVGVVLRDGVTLGGDVVAAQPERHVVGEAVAREQQAVVGAADLAVDGLARGAAETRARRDRHVAVGELHLARVADVVAGERDAGRSLRGDGARAGDVAGDRDVA